MQLPVLSGLGFSSSKSNTQSSQDVWGGQQPFLRDIYAQAQALTQGQGGVGQQAQELAGGFMPGLQGGFDTLGRLTDPTSQIAAQEASLAAGLGNLFRNEINPTISSAAIGAGGYGGGRQGVAQGVAAGELGRAYTEGLGDITGRANNQAMGAAGLMPSYAQGAFNLGMAPSQAAFQPLMNYSALVGNPTVLGKSSGSSKSFSANLGFA